MLLEQIFTAGTITELCVWKLVRAYKKLLRSHHTPTGRDGRLLEEGRGRVGTLKIGYYHRLFTFETEYGAIEPVKLHLKCTIVDGEVAVLGSGNMDRASWYTSQELGIGVYDRDFAEKVATTVREGLAGRVEGFFGHG